jgi:hypothetical protein
VKKDVEMLDNASDNLACQALEEAPQKGVESLSLQGDGPAPSQCEPEERHAISITADTDLWRSGSIFATLKVPYGGRHLPPGRQMKLNFQSGDVMTLQICERYSVFMLQNTPLLIINDKFVDEAFSAVATLYGLRSWCRNVWSVTTIFCILQCKAIELPLCENDRLALTEFSNNICIRASERLQRPEFAILLTRSPYLDYQLSQMGFLLRLRSKKACRVWVKIQSGKPSTDGHFGVEGKLAEVMIRPKNPPPAIDVTISYGLSGSQHHSTITISRYIREINRYGVFFCSEHVVPAGEIVELPPERKVPEFMG